MTLPLPVVFLGCAHPHADGRAGRLAGIDDARLVGAFDDDAAVAEALVRRHGGTLLASPEAALEAAAGGLAIIETGNRRAVELGLLAVEAGVPLLLEKPGAHRLEALRTLRDAAERTDLFVQVGYHMRYAPVVAPAVRARQDGRLGQVVTGRFHASAQAPWLTDPVFCDPDDRGGLVWLDLAHVIDLLLLLLGTPDEVICRMRELPFVTPHRHEDSAALILRFGDALLAGDVCGWETNDWIETWNVELYGTQGTLVLAPHPPRLRLWTPGSGDGDEEGWREWHHASFDGERNYEAELRDVVGRLREGRPPGGATLADAMSVLDVLEQAYADAERHDRGSRAIP